MPLICLSYLLSSSIFPSFTFLFLAKPLLLYLDYIDRTSLGNARTLNSDKPGESLVESLGLKGLKYNIIVAVFFIPCKLTSSSFPTLLPSALLPCVLVLWCEKLSWLRKKRNQMYCSNSLRTWPWNVSPHRSGSLGSWCRKYHFRCGRGDLTDDQLFVRNSTVGVSSRSAPLPSHRIPV